jgi:hypothetical protein
MSDTDPTPDTPITIRDALGWWRGELRGQLAGLIGDPAASLADLAAAISAARGTAPYNDLAALHAKMEAVRAAITNLSITNGLLADIKDALGTLHQDILDLRDDTGSGATGYLASMTVRGLLYQLVTNAQAYGINPDAQTSDLTSTNTVSRGGMRYVVWPNLPGITEDAESIGLTPLESTWSGYQVYIQSNAPHCLIYEDSGTPYYEQSVNTWISLDTYGNHKLSWAVDSSYDVRGYLRIPSQSDIIAEIENYSDPYAGNGSRYHAIIPGYVMTNSIANTTYTTNVVHVGSAVGTVLSVKSGSAIFSCVIGVGQSGTTVQLSSTPITISVDSDKFQIFSDDPFTLIVQ